MATTSTDTFLLTGPISFDGSRIRKLHRTVGATQGHYIERIDLFQPMWWRGMSRGSMYEAQLLCGPNDFVSLFEENARSFATGRIKKPPHEVRFVFAIPPRSTIRGLYQRTYSDKPAPELAAFAENYYRALHRILGGTLVTNA